MKSLLPDTEFSLPWICYSFNIDVNWSVKTTLISNSCLEATAIDKLKVIEKWEISYGPLTSFLIANYSVSVIRGQSSDNY